MKLTLQITDSMRRTRCERLSIPFRRMVIGRKRAGLLLESEQCASSHCVLYVSNKGELFIQDLRSEKGTYVNYRRVNSESLEEGDKIVIGDTLLQIMRIESDII